ncbi:unnamed protein product [Linum trigynum]|uniref:Uncharacterized protein n=1 Tax=Linum trigynum TaxID=586398 RepID=A0AAV2CQL7_9ROSI
MPSSLPTEFRGPMWAESGRAVTLVEWASTKRRLGMSSQLLRNLFGGAVKTLIWQARGRTRKEEDVVAVRSTASAGTERPLGVERCRDSKGSVLFFQIRFELNKRIK